MSYVASVIQAGEKLRHVGALHWIGYWRSAACAILALLIGFGRPASMAGSNLIWIVTTALLLLTLAFAAHTAFMRWTTEIGVTDRRVIFKRGFISRYTAEINMDKIETVDVEQSLLGRMLDYGTITIHGTGASIEELPMIADPIGLRTSITVR
jgi:uncharacterized membrane protein YdbT with pleckstrin-like domain